MLCSFGIDGGTEVISGNAGAVGFVSGKLMRKLDTESGDGEPSA